MSLSATTRKVTQYSEEFKKQMVELYNAGKPSAEICREYSIPSSTFCKWHGRNKVSNKPYLAMNRTDEDKELVSLRKEVKQLRMENDILKQAALIFARRS